MSANYGGKMPNQSAYIKQFINGPVASLWKIMSYDNKNVLTPTSFNNSNVYIPGNLYVDGSIVNPSDINIKKNIEVLNPLLTNKLNNLEPIKYTFKNDKENEIHYGFIAQDFENIFPELVKIKPDINTDTHIKAINYIEIIPLLVHRVQTLTKEIENIKEYIKCL